MGLNISGAVGAVSKAFGTGTAGWAMPLALAGLDYYSGAERNRDQIRAAREQMAFQERMSSTAYQRAMEDMRRSGLNPILAYKQGGASSPGGSMPQLIDPMDSVGSTVNSAVSAMKAPVEIEKLERETNLLFEKWQTEMSEAELRSTIEAYAEQHQQLDLEQKRQAIRLLSEQANAAKLAGTVNATKYAEIMRYIEMTSRALMGGGGIGSLPIKPR